MPRNRCDSRFGKRRSVIGEIEASIYAGDRLLYGLAAEIDAGRGEGLQAAAVKYLLTAGAIESVERGLALIGNPGLSYRHPLQRHYRDVLCSRIHAPQDDVILSELGRQALARGSG